jgi:hypothetical protein
LNGVKAKLRDEIKRLRAMELDTLEGGRGNKQRFSP